MRFSPLWPGIFQCLFLHPDLQSCTGKGTSRTSLSSTVCLLEMALAILRICFSINTKVQHLQDSRMMFGDSLVCCRCALAQLGQIPAKNQAAAGGRESSWQSQLLSLKVRGEQDPASPRGTWYLTYMLMLLQCCFTEIWVSQPGTVLAQSWKTWPNPQLEISCEATGLYIINCKSATALKNGFGLPFMPGCSISLAQCYWICHFSLLEGKAVERQHSC